MQKRWRLLKPSTDSVLQLQKQLRCDSIVAALLVNRGYAEANAAKRFLNPQLQHMRSPFDMQDMSLAVERIGRAIIQNENILIFGDYDVDGITATALLFEFLKQTAANVTFYIPHRRREGYSLKPEHIETIATSRNIDLIITADCGASSHAAMLEARRAGIDVVVTDHHEMPEESPQAMALVNPKRPDCRAGFDHLAGVGVVFALLTCLRKHLRDTGFWKSSPEPNLKAVSDLVALGTVADMVPMTAENRIWTATGLQIMSAGLRPGLTELCRVANVNPALMTAEDVAFRLAPRLNAAGRMDHADKAVHLLMASSNAQASALAKELNADNLRRQQIELEIVNEIDTLLAEQPQLLKRPALILAGENWHEGVLGIVASKLVRRFFRPVVLVALHDGMGKGSARSVAGINLFDTLQQCSDTLVGFGGHAAAAGLQIDQKQLPAFERRFETAVETIAAHTELTPEVVLDAVLELDRITPALTDALEALQPYGNQNPEPLFMAQDIHVVDAQIVGKHHLRMRLQPNHNTTQRPLSAIQFNIDPGVQFPRHFERIAYRLRWNCWNGNRRIQLLIEET